MSGARKTVDVLAVMASAASLLENSEGHVRLSYVNRVNEARAAIEELMEAADKLANVPFGSHWDTGLIPRIKRVNAALRASGRLK